MTSSERDLNPGQDRWNYAIQSLKPYDPFCEPGLISVLFLAHGRPELTEKCLDSTTIALKSYSGEIEFCFLENGLCNQNWQLFERYPCKRKKLIRSSNWGIMSAFNDLWSVSRGEYCLILENDFYNSKPDFNFMQVAKDILDQKSEVGIVSLRAIYDPFESWGYKKPEYLPYSCSEEENAKYNIKVWNEVTTAGHKYLLSKYPNIYNNNPNLMRKKLWRECGHFSEPPCGSDPRNNETHYQERVRATDSIGAHINVELYFHVGGVAKDRFLENKL